MAESSSRWQLACDRCGATAWIGRRGDVVDAWCEACQRAFELGAAAAARAPRCGSCGERLSVESPRFIEAFGELQHLAAVLAAWECVPRALAAILPSRPRFLTDLTPPPADLSDPAPLSAALESLASGAFARARAALEALARHSDADPRIWRALAIASERMGRRAAAEAALDRALAGVDEPANRLARGALRAQRADFAGARTDFSSAGDGREARWNRAALLLVEACSTMSGLPSREVIAAARAEAGPPSAYWSDLSVGRLLWALLMERAVAHQQLDAPNGQDASELRDAEQELEFDTFWDRALVLEGYARLGMRREAAAVAGPIAGRILGWLESEPFVRGAAAHEIAGELERVRVAIAAGRLSAAREAVAVLLGRADLTRYRIPCAACRAGSVGVEMLSDEAESAG